MTPASDAAVALLPCPFCGGEARLSARAASSADGGGFLAFAACYCGGFSATAHQMGRGTTEADARREAADAWNRRTPALDAAARTGVDGVEVVAWMMEVYDPETGIEYNTVTLDPGSVTPQHIALYPARAAIAAATKEGEA